MEIPDSIHKRYSNSSTANAKYSDSTVGVQQVFEDLADLIPIDDFVPFYLSRYQSLGYKQFIYLANKARAGKNPPGLFCWMLNNPHLVR